jgi:hypothetical protein
MERNAVASGKEKQRLQRKKTAHSQRKTQPTEATGFSEPCGGISAVEVTTGFELLNDGFAGQ